MPHLQRWRELLNFLCKTFLLLILISKIILQHLWAQIFHHIKFVRVWEKILQQKFMKNLVKFLIDKPPSTKELKEPDLYLKRDLSTGSDYMN